MSGSHIDLMTLRVQASAAVRARRFVTFAGAEVAAAGGKAMGVSRHAAAIGEDLAVVVSGTVIVEAGAAVAVGGTVAADAQGRAIPGATLTVIAGGTAVTSSAANGAIIQGVDPPQFPMGDALTAATAAGQFIEVLLRR
jgi:hypothetical protein